LTGNLRSERVDGPTPNGGAYAIVIGDADGYIYEISEHLADGTVITRTYNAIPPPTNGEDQPPGQAERSSCVW
jgi:hypothetical protein